MENNNFELKLHAWGEKAANICHEIATNQDENLRVDKFFYAFQSEPREEPFLLLVALNPGGNGNYIDGCRNEMRQIDRITAQEMISKNLWWDKSSFSEGHETWTIWKKLSLSFNTERMKKILNDSVYMNEIYFNTASYDELAYHIKGGREAILACQNLTKEVIFDIIKPKNILCLGVSDCFLGLGHGTDNRIILKNAKNKKLLIKKTCNNIPVYGIPHPSSARGISNADRADIGNKLEELFFE